jgi:DNA-binding transcriptional LysR family regulator
VTVLDIKQLNTFLTIARLKSFTKAAQSLDYAQSSITSQIQLLERELDVRLFERLGRNISLTPEGRKLLPFAKEIIKLSNEAKNAMNSTDLPRGTLTIGALESLCVTRLPRLLKEYRLRYPNVEIVIKFGSSNDFKEFLMDNTLDIAVLLEQHVIGGDFTTEIKFPEPMVVLSSPGHPIAVKEAVYPEDLTGEALILTEKGCSYRALFESVLTQYSVKPRSIIETGNVQAIKQLAMSGLGITLLPLVAVEEECLQRRLARLNWRGPAFEMLTQVIYHKDKWISAPLKALLELMHEIGF